MLDKKGFTLIEIIVAMIIVATIAAIAIPSYVTTMVQGEAKAAANNLVMIYGAEKSYYLSYATYCTSSSAPSPCNSLTTINLNLPLWTGSGTSAPLNITDNNFTNYICRVGSVADNGFQCTATDPNYSGFSLVVTNNPIVLIGGTGCLTNAGASCNPVCSPSTSIYCPSS